MKVLMINGSPHAKGNTYIALHEMEKIFAEEGIETEILHIGNKDIRGCTVSYTHLDVYKRQDLDCTGSGCVIYNQYVQGRSAVYSGGISGE